MKKAKSILITRQLASDSPLLGLSSEGYTVTGQSLLKINALPFTIDWTSINWLFFYSRNGVHHLHTVYDSIPVRIKVGCIGLKTAEIFEDLFARKASFTGNGDPETTAIAFQKEIKPNDKICFLRAKRSKKSIQKQISAAEIQDLIVYDNSINQKLIINRSDIVVCTSPMNAKAYLEKGVYDGETKFIAIGKTTRAFLMRNGVAYVGIPEYPSEKSIKELIEQVY